MILLKVSRKANGLPEIFYSVQGEGITIGTPSVFLRLALCNLACIWCDSKYTWDWTHYDPAEQIIEMSIDAIAEEIAGFHCKHLVVTGGEPMIQHNQLVHLLGELKRSGYYIEVETNGTIIPCSDTVSVVDLWSVSPKLENSGNSLLSREVPEAYRFFRSLPSSYFKYVVQNKDDIKEVEREIQKYDFNSSKIVLMPEARDRETLIKRSAWLVELCKSRGYAFSLRLQTLLWGNKRGV